MLYDYWGTTLQYYINTGLILFFFMATAIYAVACLPGMAALETSPDIGPQVHATHAIHLLTISPPPNPRRHAPCYVRGGDDSGVAARGRSRAFRSCACPDFTDVRVGEFACCRVASRTWKILVHTR